VVAAACLSLAILPLQVPLTKAEASSYKETTSHAEVLAFISSLQSMGAPITLEFMGKSDKGKEIPLVVVADPPVASPAHARRTGKVIIYLQANIHGGEVEGKESMLMLLRDIATGKRAPLLEKAILLVCPIYNSDGNDEFGEGLRNRGSQDGPDIVGQRANGAGLDLNRDCIKAESPEMRAVLASVYNVWDPDVAMDLHTTNGTRHGYQLTYSPPTIPTVEPAIMKFTRDEMLPRIRSNLRMRYGMELFDYGNAATRSGSRVFETFGVEGRYTSNYIGLRNRIGVLSEATSYLAFQDRIEATTRFVDAVLDEVTSDPARTLALTRGADETVISWGKNPSAAPPMGVRFAIASRGEEDVLLEVARPIKPVPRNKRPVEIEAVKMPVFDRFTATKTAPFPAAYAFPASHKAAAELLMRHGIVVESLDSPASVAAERFTVSEAVVAQTAFQGHKLIRLEGTFSAADVALDPGSYIVRTAQPLGILIFHMLEPEGLDGAMSWGYFGESFEVGAVFPVAKLMSPPKLSTRLVRKGE
jgi:hypothetical protein